MAQVAVSTEQKIDRLLDDLTSAWEDLPRVAKQIDQWDLIEQIDYIEEWAVREDQAARLRRLIDSPAATPEQCQRYARLAHLMGVNRPILEKLRAS